MKARTEKLICTLDFFVALRNFHFRSFGFFWSIVLLIFLVDRFALFINYSCSSCCSCCFCSEESCSCCLFLLLLLLLFHIVLLCLLFLFVVVAVRSLALSGASFSWALLAPSKSLRLTPTTSGATSLRASSWRAAWAR